LLLPTSGIAGASPRGAADPVPVWVRRHDGRTHGNDSAHKLHPSPDGSRVYVAGSEDVGTQSFRAMLLAYSTDTGALVWKAFQGGQRGAVFFDVAVDPTGGRVFGIGGSYGTNPLPNRALIRAYDAATGAVGWTASVPVRGAGLSGVVSPDGSRLFVEGIRTLTDGTLASVMVAYDTLTGAVVWSSGYVDRRHPGFANPAPIQMSSDGSRLYVAGSGGFPTRQYFVAFAVDASNGHRLWAKTFAPHHASGSAIDAALSVDGQTFVAVGRTSETGFTTVAYDTLNGSQLWFATHTGDASPTGIAMSPDDTRVYATGYETVGTQGVDEFVTIAYDRATGAQLWVNTYATGDPNRTAVAVAIAPSPDGNHVVVAGYADTGDGYAVVTHVVAAVGGLDEWTGSYLNPVHRAGGATDVTVGPDSQRVLVVGDLLSVHTGIDVVALAYDL
jgi:hypothetical protein